MAATASMDHSDSDTLDPSLRHVVHQQLFKEWKRGVAPVHNVELNHDLKWIFVGGKGGVGKTTVSSSLAVQLAATRRSVLIISTDPAHNLSDAFRQKFSRNPTLVQGFSNLYAMEVEPTLETDQLDMLGLSGAPINDPVLTEIAGSIPGIDEAMSFAEMLKLVQSMDYSVIVFDTAPTGHTLRLLQFPNALEAGLKKLMTLKNRFSGLFSQFTRMLGPAAEGLQEEQLLGKLEGLQGVVATVNSQFKDPNMTTFVCVCIPEFLSLYETERLVQDLAKFHIDVQNIVVNQVLFSEDIIDKLLMARMKMQQKYIDQFYDLYEDFHIVKLPLLPEEVRGVDALKDFSKYLITPYVPPPRAADSLEGKVLALQKEVDALKHRNEQLESELKRLQVTS
eukprot:jgi/Chlat1/4289/Chrsp29S00324